MKTVIIGSYGKHFSQILELRDHLISQETEVLVPTGSKVINPGSDFLMLETDPEDADPKSIQDMVFEKIKEADYIVLANVDGYIGRTAAFEMGYAIALGLPVYTLEKVTDPNIAGYCSLLERP